MEFMKDDVKIPLLLPTKSLLTMKEEVRYDWKHGIKQAQSNVKSRRVSITFREVI